MSERKVTDAIDANKPQSTPRPYENKEKPTADTDRDSVPNREPEVPEAD